MVFRLRGRPLRAEVPLLPHDLAERLSPVRRPTQDVLLRALSDRLEEMQPDPAEPLRMRKEEPNCLLAWHCGAPARAITGQQCGSMGCVASSEVISTSAKLSILNPSWS